MRIQNRVGSLFRHDVLAVCGWHGNAAGRLIVEYLDCDYYGELAARSIPVDVELTVAAP